MNTVRAYVQPYVGAITEDTPTAPILIPDLNDVRQFSDALHAVGREWQGILFGWPARYLPEIDESRAEFEVYDQHGNVSIEIRPHWSPAYFSIGIEGVWSFARLWEQGTGQAPEETTHSNLVLEPTIPGGIH